MRSEMNECEQWLEARRAGLGGSDIAAIFGLSRWKTPHDVWLEKTGRKTEDADSLQLRFGTYAEEFVAQEYTRATGRGVQRFNAMLRHPTAPLIGNVDRLVIPDGAKRASHKSEIRTDRGLECKTANAFAASNSLDWGAAGTDEVPMQYWFQCQQYIALTGCRVWDLAVLFGNQEVRIYTIKRDDDVIASIEQRSTEWWNDHVVADIPPPPVTESQARERWPRHQTGKQVEAGSAEIDAVALLSSLRKQIKELEEAEQLARDTVCAAFGDAESLVSFGRTLATWKQNKPSKCTDWKGVVDDLRDIDEAAVHAAIAANVFEKPGARVLRIAKQEQ